MSIVYYSNNDDARIILSYVYDKLKEKDPNIPCECVDIDKRDNKNHLLNTNDYIFLHRYIPLNGKYKIDNIEIEICDYVLNCEVVKINYKTEFYVIKKVTLTSENREDIEAFAEKAINEIEKKRRELFSRNFNGKIEKKRFSYCSWGFDSAMPKRSLESLFLKENQVEEIKNPINEFLNKETYADYTKHGIPYKINIMLHGPPGVGKTSLIHAIASICDASICNLNINAELTENDMIRAVTTATIIEKKSILVIEDIDCIFTDRKPGDTNNNHITLNGLLNCLDGFNNPEGLIVIITTNYPEKLDEALVRSGRIDINIELSYLDKYQTRNMFLSFFNDESAFEEMWENIKKYKIEPATLMQFLFSNRKNANIKDKFEELYDKLQKKSLKDGNKDLYM